MFDYVSVWCWSEYTPTYAVSFATCALTQAQARTGVRDKLNSCHPTFLGCLYTEQQNQR
jgi:hypothetical protein